MSDWVLNMPKYYLFAKYIESQQINQQSLFSVKLSDNSKVFTVLYYHNRSTIQRDKPKNSNSSQVIESDSNNCNFWDALIAPRFIPWNLLFYPTNWKSLAAFCLSD